MSYRDAAGHPRPQLTRPGWVDLSGEWCFAHDDGRVGLDEGWHMRAELFARRIMVPYPPESEASGVGATGYHPVVWYRHAFVRPEGNASGGDGRLLLHFGAVDYRAEVWVNGVHVASHEGGHTPFSADITAALRPEGEQIVTVRAEDDPTDLAQPRGKQDWREEPHKIWYHRTTGIWQPVWLEPVPASRVTDLRWTPDAVRGVIGLRATIAGWQERDPRLRVVLSLGAQVLSDDTYSVREGAVERAIALEPGVLAMERDRLLWSPTYPNLIDAEVTLLEGERVLDRVSSYLGLRDVGTAGGRFLLNGRPYFLRLALEQGYWPTSHLAAPDDAALKREVELALSLGFNGVRIHQKVEDPRFLYWCDRLGLLVWGEMPAAYAFTPRAIARTTREWLEVLARDHSHPCIVCWVPFNESWGVPDVARDPAQAQGVRALYALTRALDPSRPAIGNDGWEYVAGDLVGVHDYSVDGATLRERYGSKEALEHTMQQVQPGARWVLAHGLRYEAQPVVLSEYGGISLRPASDEEWFGYGTVTTSEAFLAKYRELTEALLDSPALAGFCYTQLTDTGQETNGLLTAERRPKLDPAAVRAITARHAAAVPADIIVALQRTRGFEAGEEGAAGTIESVEV